MLQAQGFGVTGIMHSSPRSLLLIIKEVSEAARETGSRMAQLLTERGIETVSVSSPAPVAELREAGQGKDAALVLGGDGTILGAARALMGLDIPLVGFNFGQVGFLAEIAPDQWQDALSRLLNGDFQVQRYAALSWDVCRATASEDTSLRGWALNDVVLARGNMARAVSLDLTVDEIPLTRLHCDGLIVASPLGATAYSASAHGPLVCPSLASLLLTPICPFAGSFAPLVLGVDAEILLEPVTGSDAYLTVDGQVSMALQPGDRLRVRGAADKFQLLVSDTGWYLHRLRERGFIHPGPVASG